MKTATLRDYKRRILRVLVHIQQHLDERLDLEALASLACFSPYHFHRVFTGMIGETLKGYVRRLRLERAAGRLKLETASVTEIALDAGYESLEAFTRSFRTCFGVTPSRFRLSRKYRPRTESPSGLHFAEGRRPTGFRTTQGGSPDMKVMIVHRKAVRVAFKRHAGPYSKVGDTWDQLLPVLGKAGWLGGSPQFIGICHDDPDITPQARIRYDACVTVDESFVPENDIGIQTIPGGDYACTTHFGAYRRLGETYTRLLGHWLPHSGRELRGTPCFEVYLNDPQGTPPADLLTDIYALLKAGIGGKRLDAANENQKHKARK